MFEGTSGEAWFHVTEPHMDKRSIEVEIKSLGWRVDRRFSLETLGIDQCHGFAAADSTARIGTARPSLVRHASSERSNSARMRSSASGVWILSCAPSRTVPQR